MKFRLDDDTCRRVCGLGVFGRHLLNNRNFCQRNFGAMLLERETGEKGRERERERERGEKQTTDKFW